ncbi:MAG: isochorismatase family protein [Chloroflexi bacterium]|nr:MAG: isochorismatase family protein [Chloroflexota bacterium]
MSQTGRTVLIAVDVQRDFLPGGALGVPGGDQVIAPLVELAAGADMVVATRDFHPSDHVSFSTRGGPWPPHCVIGTPGAALAPEVDAVASFIVSKGTDAQHEAYSGFDGTGLADMLRAQRVTRVIVGGLATDYCVKATAIAASEAGFDTEVVTDAVRAVDVTAGDGARALEAMAAAGVRLGSLAGAQQS